MDVQVANVAGDVAPIPGRLNLRELALGISFFAAFLPLDLRELALGTTTQTVLTRATLYFYLYQLQHYLL